MALYFQMCVNDAKSSNVCTMGKNCKCMPVKGKGQTVFASSCNKDKTKGMFFSIKTNLQPPNDGVLSKVKSLIQLLNLHDCVRMDPHFSAKKYVKNTLKRQ